MSIFTTTVADKDATERVYNILDELGILVKKEYVYRPRSSVYKQRKKEYMITIPIKDRELAISVVRAVESGY